MHLYTVLFRTDGEDASSAHEINAADDAEAVGLARRHLRSASGFDVRRDGQIVHSEPPAHRGAGSASKAPGKWSGSRLGESHVAYLDFAAEVERRRQSGQRLSPVYRIYLRDHASDVVSGHTIAAESDDAAIRVASILCCACADVTAKFEVWKGEMLLNAGTAVAALPTPSGLSQRNQQIVIERELAIRDSHAALAESGRLMDAIDEWQAGEAAPRRRAK